MIENIEGNNQSSKRDVLMEQIKQLDDYFYNKGIGQEGELIRYVLTYEEILTNPNFMRNIEIVLQYQNSCVFDDITKKLKCNTIDDYCKIILCASHLEEFYNAYVTVPHNTKSIGDVRNENGIIILEPKDYFTINAPATGSYGGRWYLLNNGTEVFIKKIRSMNEAYAELVAEQIAKQMGIPYAQYDLINIEGTTKIASINFLEEGQELVDGTKILPDLKVKDIDSICRSFCRFLKTRYPNLSEEDIQKIKEGFLKITIFDKIIANWDRNPGNWGIIVLPNGDVKISHELDNNKALNISEYYQNYERRDMHLNNNHKLETLLEYCFNNFSNPHEFIEFIENCRKNIDVRRACQDIQIEKGISIPHVEIMEMQSIVQSNGLQQMRWWIDRIKSTPGISLDE